MNVLSTSLTRASAGRAFLLHSAKRQAARVAPRAAASETAPRTVRVIIRREKRLFPGQEMSLVWFGCRLWSTESNRLLSASRGSMCIGRKTTKELSSEVNGAPMMSSWSSLVATLDEYSVGRYALRARKFCSVCCCCCC